MDRLLAILFRLGSNISCLLIIHLLNGCDNFAYIQNLNIFKNLNQDKNLCFLTLKVFTKNIFKKLSKKAYKNWMKIKKMNQNNLIKIFNLVKF